MKIDLDLSDIYQDEEGYKMKTDFIGLVASSIASDLKTETMKSIKEAINRKITALIHEHVEKQMESVLSSFLDFQYDEVTSWGEKKGTWTVRDRIAAAIKDSVGFERKDFWSSGKETPFTRLLVKAIDEHIKPLTSELRDTVNLEFKKACIDSATKQLRETLKLQSKEQK